MKKPKRTAPIRFLWLAGAAGFGVAFFSSLAGGNLFVTSFERGVFGFILTSVAYWIIQFLFSFLGQKVSETETNNDAAQPGTSGTHFDVSLPAEPLDIPPSPGDFQPWTVADDKEPEEEQIANLVRAVRAMKE
ncbi:hypothetical protein [Effusibacillus consociatus]|uniref:Uncharacterized protein n=1 Tax=Effusibacillus consociatus TaxID=1117041 RepID=A0ABV9Q423_9BACL